MHVIGLGTAVGGMRLGLGPAVLVPVRGLAVHGSEVHASGQRGDHVAVGPRVRAVRLLDRLEPGGEHAHAHRMPVQVGHLEPGHGPQPVSVGSRPLAEHVLERVVRVCDGRVGRDRHRVHHGPSPPGGPKQLAGRGLVGVRHQPYVMRHWVPGGRPFGDQQLHVGRLVGDHQHHLLVRPHVRRRPVGQQDGSADGVVDEPQTLVRFVGQRVHDQDERLHVPDGGSA